MRKSTGRVLAVASCSALIAGAMVVAAAPASAATTTTDFTATCVAGSTIGDQVENTSNSMSVTAPTSVSAGETFTYRIQPGPGSYPDKQQAAGVTATLQNLSRLKYDYEIPDNATFVSATVVPATAVNLGGVTPNVLRIDDSGNVNSAGEFLRLSGNNEVIGNSPTSSEKAEGGIVVPKTKNDLDGSPSANGATWFRMPAVDVTLKAGASGTVEPRVRVSGDAANSKNAKNFSTQLGKATAKIIVNTTQWAPTYCSPRDSNGAALNAGGGPLATIQIESAPVDVETVTSLSVPGSAVKGDEVTLSASVSPNPGGGTVQFKADGVNLGAAVAVSNGVAELQHSFGSSGDRVITAVFSGVAGFAGSTSAAKTIEISDPAPGETSTTVKVVAPATVKTGSTVDLKAELTPSNLSGGTVQFKINGDDVGAPVAVTDGEAKLPHTFAAAGDFTVTAIYSGTTGHSGSISGPALVAVSDDAGPGEPGTPGTPGGNGSLGSSSGSLEGLGSLGGSLVSGLSRGVF